jgi:hypothetical protein
MESIILWMFFLVMQNGSQEGHSFVSKTACDSYREEAVASDQVIALSECFDLKITRKSKQPVEKG